MSEAGPTRVAVVGLGWAAREIWLRRLQSHPAYEVVAVVDPDATARGAAQARYPGIAVLGTTRDLDPAAVDLAVVAVPNHLHAEVAEGLLERGLAVFVEKPVCLTSAEAQRLAEAERAGGGLLLAGSAARHRADVRALYAAVREIGPVRHIEASWVRARGVPAAGGWFTHRELSGGGALLDLGWHLFDVVAPLLGHASFDQVAGAFSADFVANGAAAAGWRQDGAGRGAAVDVEDTARAFLVTDAQVSVALRTSWASHEPFDVTSFAVEGRSGKAALRCTFGFSPQREGGSRLVVTRYGEAADRPLPEEPIGVEYDRQLDELQSRLRDPGSRSVAAEDTLRTIQVIERLYASARSELSAPHPDAAGVPQR
ncbi:Gfo/Idh/MocA family protein [Streptomyces sp. NBC_00102]|uniref:Gfo/Idh/MocA family protein n=1 Tax=Streptomyces sp. NBC_00102 TaxID=2975652 RepID=UPI002254CB6E|nr:Gfo/Idh/MocA family oxidoreductase [Streptomyces sp. NBC_00102]MCX5399865.1 Gfo/Idh/MocA family oxidoreductase [Streptomyces sp. NBC_00102]